MTACIDGCAEQSTKYVGMLCDSLHQLCKPDSKGDPKTILESLERNMHTTIQELKTKLNSNRDKFVTPPDHIIEHLNNIELMKGSKRWMYISTCMEVLKNLSRCLSAIRESFDSTTEISSKTPKAPMHLLSLDQLKVIRSVLQFISALGFVPNFAPGVGIQPESRGKWIGYISSVVDLEKSSWIVREHELYTCTHFLLEVAENDQFNSEVLEPYLPDILAALIQLGFAHRKEPLPDEDDNSSSNPYCVTRMNQSRVQRCHMALTSLIRRVSKPLLIKSLLVIQSSNHSQHKVQRKDPPRWLLKKCMNLLHSVVVESNGILHLLEASFGAESSSPEEWKKLESTTYLLCNLLHVTSESEAYVSSIWSQVKLDDISPCYSCSQINEWS